MLSPFRGAIEALFAKCEKRRSMKPAVRFAIALLLLLPLYTALAQTPLVLEPAVVRKQITVSPGGTVYEEMGCLLKLLYHIEADHKHLLNFHH